VGIRRHAGALSHLDKRAGERKCRPRDAGFETASVESLPQKEETGRSDEIVGIATSAGFWQPRSHDFNVFTERKHVEKPSSVNKRYVHRNPVKRGLVTSPELWRWSSFRYYSLGEEGPVKIGAPSIPPFAAQRVGHP
jgi:hypothetical protein